MYINSCLNLTDNDKTAEGEPAGAAETFGIPRRRRPAGNGNEGRDNKSPAPQYHNSHTITIRIVIEVLGGSVGGFYKRFHRPRRLPFGGTYLYRKAP
jgi:hypothetical protein